MNDRNGIYRMIPKVDELLASDWAKEAAVSYGKKRTLDAVRETLDALRAAVSDMPSEERMAEAVENLPASVEKRLEKTKERHFQRVCNATGVILHTNLGRAPFDPELLASVTKRLCGYSNLEYDLDAGCRGERYAHFEELICKITGAEAALAVNNNAAAVLLMLGAVAASFAGKDAPGAAPSGCRNEVIVSRGEQIEIGGKFRIPDILSQSGCRMIEVGTTNKTRISDYAQAIGPDTAALLKVHTSNFRIEGFTESVTREELCALGKERGIPVIEDLGSGVLIDLSAYGMKKEPTVMDSVEAGADLVSFSGDKLLGGPQAGIIVGKKEWVDRCKRHPLTRAVRIDKFTAAYLEEIFSCYRDPERAVSKIPVLSMLTEPVESLARRAAALAEQLSALSGAGYSVSVRDCESAAGGGSLPGETFPGKGVFITGGGLHPAQAAEALRHVKIPVILRTEKDGLLLDVRTLRTEELPDAAAGLLEVLSGGK